MEYTFTLKQAGAQSATWLLTHTEGGPFITLDSSHWAQLPEGPLKETLTKQYLSSAPADTTLFSQLADVGLKASTIGTFAVYFGVFNLMPYVEATEGEYGPLAFKLRSEIEGCVVITLSVDYSVEA